MPNPKPKHELTGDAATKIVGFRIDLHDFEQLEERAKLAGTKSSMLARRFVLDALNQESQLDELRERLLALEGAMSSLRGDIAFSTEALLIGAGKTPKEQAVTWVTKNLKRS